ncbi:hydrolase protein [Pochonia chlamydosporia 170]|uniref:Hydrolase protein n=1 Tax=Pochonia chlamydosporia 170 TaxID=1380566 RepID=A0A179G484_METCM|nr:hydrolase protein [Pochonia chlamydosporia 170]OAQ72607.1 hydrolase protein [Pochonia chlamydosporia 170]
MTPPINTAAAHPPAKTALLLLDYHNHIVDMIKPPETKTKVINAASSLLKAARESSATIVHCVIDMDAQPVETSKIRERWESTYKPMIASTPEKLAITADLAPATSSSEKEFTVGKVPGCVSAMKTPGFVNTLREKHGVESLVICGLISSGAVVSTAREAADLGFVTTVVEDGCWDYDAACHEAIMRNVLQMTAYTTDLKGGLELLGAGS